MIYKPRVKMLNLVYVIGPEFNEKVFARDHVLTVQNRYLFVENGLIQTPKCEHTMRILNIYRSTSSCVLTAGGWSVDVKHSLELVFFSIKRPANQTFSCFKDNKLIAVSIRKYFPNYLVRDLFYILFQTEVACPRHVDGRCAFVRRVSIVCLARDAGNWRNYL